MTEIKDTNLIRDALGSPVPQYWDETSQMYIARTVDGSFADVDFSKIKLLRDSRGTAVPQLWDVETARFVPSKGSGNGEVTIGSVTGLQTKLDQTTATLADTAKQDNQRHHLKYRGEVNALSNTGTGRGCVVITDDGGRRELVDIVKPVLDLYGFKVSIAQEMNVVGKEGHLSMAELKALSEEGHEIMSHSMTHADMSTLNEEQIIYELAESKRIFKENGMEPTNYVYPYNVAPLLAKKNVLKYYRSASGLGSSAIKPPFPQEMLQRVGLGSYQEKTTDQLKTMCMQAKTNGEMLVFMTHFGFFNGGGISTVEESYQSAIEIIHYCAANDIEILTLDEALDRLGNISQIGTMAEGGYEIIGSDKKLYTDLPLRNSLRIGRDELDVNRPPSFYNKYLNGNIPTTIYFAATVSDQLNPNLPVTEMGLLTTSKVSESGVLDTQEFRSTGKKIKYMRVGLEGSDAWSEWVLVGDYTQSYPASALPNNEPPSYFDRFIESTSNVSREMYFRFGGADTTNPNLPIAKAGTLKVTKVSTSGILDKQEFIVSATGETYQRFGQSASSWGAWRKLANPSGFTSQRPTGVDKGYLYFDTTLSKPIWWSGTAWVDATGATV